MPRILVPIAGTSNDRYAVQDVLKRCAADPATEVHLINVQTPFPGDIARFTSDKSRHDHHAERAEQALAPVRELLDERGIAHTVHTPVGDRAQLITDTARELSCDVIVMATTRKNSLTRLVENSVVDRVLELTTVPVAIVAGDAMSPWERYGIPTAIGAAVAAAVAAID